MDISKIQRHLPQIIRLPEKLTISDKCKIEILCKECHKIVEISIRNLVRKWSDKEYLCKSCHIKTYSSNPDKIEKFQKSFAKIATTSQHKEKCSQAAKKLWADPELRERVTKAISEDHKINPKKKAARERAHKAWMKKHGKIKLLEMMSIGHQKIRKKCKEDIDFKGKLTKQLENAWKDEKVRKKHRKSTSLANARKWKDPEYRLKMSKLYNRKEYKDMLSRRAKEMWRNPEYRKKMERLYADPDYKKKMSEISKEINSRPEVKKAKAIALANQPSISKQEDILADILTDMGISFERQVLIGYYPFDFLIKRNDQKDLLIEVNGVWHHMKPEKKARDAAKATYIKDYYSDKYDLRCIWDHEFGSLDRVRQIILSFIGDLPKQIDFNFKDVVINTPVDSKDARIFLSKYHYLGKIGRHGLIVEYKLNNILIGCITFSTVTRAQSAHRLGLTVRETYELTRLCIHPCYQKKNFASWMISRAVKRLWVEKDKAKCVISFADPLYGHEGHVYKAAGWSFDSMSASSYFYRDNDGFVMHKKTLYNHARSAHMSESDFAGKFGYVKISVPPKYRYIVYK